VRASPYDTVMDLGLYKDGWAARRLAEREADERARLAARAELPRLVEVLVRDFGVDRVVLIGSLARGDFRADSDIDLVARGLRGAALFTAGAALERVSARAVDLIPMEEASAELLAVMASEGEVLHGLA
jgi:predicted nucleotidyltransferase